MSIDLTSQAGQELSVRGSAWDFILNFAEAYGWKPAGTLPPQGVRPDKWPGNYDSSDGQTVTTEDARALASALRRAEADPQRAATESRVSKELAAAVRRIMLRDHGIDLPSDDAADEWHLEPAFLNELASFLELGSLKVD